ncbi:MAG: AAA family ATPase, partial [Planctomycetota bacterium]
MKFQDLKLIRFGPFTDYSLDLDSGQGDFHLIYGNNEAGKSTTRRAVMGLLFGIPATTADHHVHKMPDLRIGARILDAHDRALHLIRRKGRKETLLDGHEKPVPESVLSACLDGVGKALFETSFCLSHESLVAGAHDLLSGKGELGESLFGAGLGVREIHALRSDLRDRAQQIFAAKASKRPLNATIQRFKEAKRQIAQESLRPSGWHDLHDRLKEVEAQLAALEEEQVQVLSRLNRLVRIQRIVPQVLKREDLLARKERLGAVQIVDPSSKDKRKSALQTLETAKLLEKKRSDEKAQIEARWKPIEVPEALLAREEEIEKLCNDHNVHIKGMRDREELRVRAETAYQELRVLLQDLRSGVTPDQAHELRLDTATRARIQSLMNSFTRIDTAIQKALDNMKACENRVSKASRTLAPLPERKDRAGLQCAQA